MLIVDALTHVGAPLNVLTGWQPLAELPALISLCPTCVRYPTQLDSIFPKTVGSFK